MTSQLGTCYEGAILLFTSGCKTSGMEGEAKSKKGEKVGTQYCVTDGQIKQAAKAIPAHLAFLCTLSQREAKQKQKWMTFTKIHMHRLACQQNTLPCAPKHFEASCFSRSVLIGTPVDFKRFYLEEGSVPSIYAKPKDSLDINYSKNEGRLANQFFLQKRSLDVSLGTLLRNVSIQNSPPPPPKKN